MKKDISKLPKWAQEIIGNKEFEATRARSELETIKNIHRVLSDDDRGWFVISNNLEDRCKLFRLYRDSFSCVCDLGKGDTLFVGRKKK